MSSFAAGFAARHDAAAAALHQAFAVPHQGFSPADIKARASGPRPKSFAPQPPGPMPGQNGVAPKHFSPADRDQQPTEGWDPLDPQVDAATSFVDPIETARAAGFSEGMAHAQALAREAGERNLALIEAVANALKDAGRIDRDAIAQQLRETVLALVTKLVGEVGITPDRLADRVRAAVDLIAESAESAILRVHPDDVALLKDRLPETVFPVGDEAIERGGFVLESAATIVEGNPGLWLDQLAQAIDRVAVPTC